MRNANMREAMSVCAFDITHGLMKSAVFRTGLSLVNRIVYRAGARECGIGMPPTTVLNYVHPTGGTQIMLLANLDALNHRLQALARIRADHRTMTACHPIVALPKKGDVPKPLAASLQPARQLLVKAVAP